MGKIKFDGKDEVLFSSEVVVRYKSAPDSGKFFTWYNQAQNCAWLGGLVSVAEALDTFGTLY